MVGLRGALQRHGSEFAEQALDVLPSLVEDGRRIAEVIGAETDE